MEFRVTPAVIRNSLIKAAASGGANYRRYE
jgi:hypothetical protein